MTIDTSATDSRRLPDAPCSGFRWRGMPWDVGRARKTAKCWHTGMRIEAGEIHYRPVSNSTNRYRRLAIIPGDATNLLFSQNQPSQQPPDAGTKDNE